MQIYSKSEILNQVKDFVMENPGGVLEILGPTASGKTGFSIELARFIDLECDKKVEIISVDSRQVYRDCDVSSAKITTEEMQGVPHHGLDLVDLDEEYNVVKFQAYCFRVIEEIQSRGNIPVLCGGTTLWLDAVSENYVFSEIQNGESVFEKSNQRATPKWPVYKIGLHWDRTKLYERLNARAVYQFENGMIEETKTIIQKYPNVTKSAFTSFGYKEIRSYLEDEMTYEEALELNQKRNRNYAKRQSTWWRGRQDVNWVQLNK